MSEKSASESGAGVVRRAAWPTPRLLPLCSARAWPWSRRPRPISTVRAARTPRAWTRSAALAYATESMRLTTRLMQLASWLLLHRAVKEGEMSLAQAHKEKTKVKLAPGETSDEHAIALLPARLRDLVARSRALRERVRRLDATIYAAGSHGLPPTRSSVSSACSRRLSKRARLKGNGWDSQVPGLRFARSPG